ncbi:MAG: hypothetical protein LUF92_06075 [Clostridiales bacterium]|nr:hypothetical protein [Clostridiales bacterium]
MTTEKRLRLSIKIQGEPLVAPRVQMLLCVWAVVMFWTFYIEESLSFRWSEIVLALLGGMIVFVFQLAWQGRYSSRVIFFFLYVLDA